MSKMDNGKAVKDSQGNSVFLTLPQNMSQNQPLRLLIVENKPNNPQILINQNPSSANKPSTPLVIQQPFQQTGIVKKIIVPKQEFDLLETTNSNVGNSQSIILSGYDIPRNDTSCSGENQILQMERSVGGNMSQNVTNISSGTVIHHAPNQQVTPHQQLMVVNSQENPSVMNPNEQIVLQDQDLGIVYEEFISDAPVINVGPFDGDTTQAQNNLGGVTFTSGLSQLSSIEPTVIQENDGQVEESPVHVNPKSTKKSRPGHVGLDKTMVKSIKPSGGQSGTIGDARQGADGRFHCGSCQKSYTTKGMLHAHFRQMHTEQNQSHR